MKSILCVFQAFVKFLASKHFHNYKYKVVDTCAQRAKMRSQLDIFQLPRTLVFVRCSTP